MNSPSTSTSASPSATASTGRLKDRIKQDSKEKIESGKLAAADQIDEIADALDLAGSQLDQSQPTVAGYASRLAGGVGSLATRLRNASMEDLLGDARKMASRNPGLFLLGSAALGIVITRFMRASVEPAGERSADTELGASDLDADDDATSGDSDVGLEERGARWPMSEPAAMPEEEKDQPGVRQSASDAPYVARNDGG